MAYLASMIVCFFHFDNLLKQNIEGFAGWIFEIYVALFGIYVRSVRLQGKA